jgi:hypothetical protein
VSCYFTSPKTLNKITYFSDERKIIAFATSSSLAILYIGILAAALALRDYSSVSFKPAYLYKFVSTIQGATQFTLTPKGANSKALVFVSISIPALAMQYPINPVSGLLPFSLLTLIIQPLDCFKKGTKN